jgi:hypothetical protein
MKLRILFDFGNYARSSHINLIDNQIIDYILQQMIEFLIDYQIIINFHSNFLKNHIFLPKNQISIIIIKKHIDF